MIEIDGTALPLEPGKTYLLLLKNGAVPRSFEHEILKGLDRLGVRGMIVRVQTDVNDVRVVQVDPAEGPVKVQGNVEVVR